MRVSKDQLELYFWLAAGRGGEGASFSMMSAFGHTSVDWCTNQSRQHPIIHWLPEESYTHSVREMLSLWQVSQETRARK